MKLNGYTVRVEIYNDGDDLIWYRWHNAPLTDVRQWRRAVAGLLKDAWSEIRGRLA